MQWLARCVVVRAASLTPRRVPIAATLFLLVASFLGAARASGHAGEGILPVRLAVTEWASALQGRDKDAMAALLSEQFPQKVQYLATLPLTPVTRVDLHHATLNIRGDTATFTLYERARAVYLEQAGQEQRK